MPAEIPCLKKEMGYKLVSRDDGSYVRDMICMYAVGILKVCTCYVK